MSILSKIGAKLGGIGASLFDNKGVKKTLSSATVKTTSSLTQASGALAGGKSVKKTVLSQFAKSAGGTFAKVGGKVFAIGLPVGGAVVGGTAIYNYVKESAAKTPEQIQAEQAFNLYKKYSDYDINKGLNNNERDGDIDSSGFSRFLYSITDKTDDTALEKAKNNQTKTIVLGALGLAVIASGLYIYSKRKKNNHG